MPKFQVQRLIPPDDPNLRVYFSREEMTHRAQTAIRGQRPRHHDSFLEALLAIPGIVLVTLQPYSATIARNPMFQWEEIESHILRLFSAFNIGEGRLEDNPSEELAE